MIFLLDNYDSFTYNLFQYMGALGREVNVARNDRIRPDEILSMEPEAIVISPGPGNPDSAGITLELLKAVGGSIPILGVCLGHQAIVQSLGGRVVRSERIMHGKTSSMSHDGKTLYQGIRNPFSGGRYHSLIAEEDSLPECLEVSCRSEHGEIMGVRHRELPIEGVQFHPESVLTQSGKRLLRNFLTLVDRCGNRQTSRAA
ncbi:MAG: aminodeoxychorismate/anthranilate synthase component II [Deltaproteobacteria bacterium]|nr:aminodeoxychorismate/anthranilate synthase component II [Deltaproteobacteria bacterium]